MLRFDIHLHTNRYSADSAIPPDDLIKRAVKMGLHGLVITEHHHQWTEDELLSLSEDSGETGFVCLSGLEYTTSRGDLLVYGADADEAMAIKPGAPPAEAAAYFTGLGAVCVAAHPTRAMAGFDERLFDLPVVAIEAASMNIDKHETKLAETLAEGLEKPMTAASDAHRLQDIGSHWIEISSPVRTMADLRTALQGGTFLPHY